MRVYMISGDLICIQKLILAVWVSLNNIKVKRMEKLKQKPMSKIYKKQSYSLWISLSLCNSALI